VQATVPQKTAVARLVQSNYPDLPAQLLSFLNEQQPGFVETLQPALEELLSANYPDLSAFVQHELLSFPQLHQLVDRLIAERYPGFVTDLHKLAGAENPATAAAQLVQKKYPQLPQELSLALHQQFPGVVWDIEVKLLARYPDLLSDAAMLVLRRYPGLTMKLLAYMAQHYPTALPDILRLLAQTPPAAPPASPPAAAAGGSPPADQPTAGQPARQE
jgi:hypothetical protein